LETHAFDKENVKAQPRGRGRAQGRGGKIHMKSKSVVAPKAEFESTFKLNNAKKSC
jgi:hypothetical protein